MKVFTFLKNKKAQSVLEYATIISLFIIVITVFFPYMKRGISGRWKLAGDMWGHEKQFDGSGPGTGTLECAYDRYNKAWYEVPCYEANECDKQCFGSFATEETCKTCIALCVTVSCK